MRRGRRRWGVTAVSAVAARVAPRCRDGHVAGRYAAALLGSADFARVQYDRVTEQAGTPDGGDGPGSMLSRPKRLCQRTHQ